LRLFAKSVRRCAEFDDFCRVDLSCHNNPVVIAGGCLPANATR
jgi:hypothetical protein